MRFFKRVAGLLGFGNHEVNKESEDGNDVNGNSNLNPLEGIPHYNHANLPRKGFSVSVRVPVDRAQQIGPVLVPCAAGDGGVQGLAWYTKCLKIDEDGDVADEFLDEVFPETVHDTEEVNYKTFSRFEVKLSAKPAKAKNPCLSREGTVQQYVEFQGRLQLV